MPLNKDNKPNQTKPKLFLIIKSDHSAGAVEYVDCISAEF